MFLSDEAERQIKRMALAVLIVIVAALIAIGVMIGRSQRLKEVIEVPAWVPEIYRSSYAAIAAFEDEHEAAAWARTNMAYDRIARKNGWLV
jgi:hypothetical protein